MSGLKSGLLAGIGRGGKKVNPYAGQILTVISGSTTVVGADVQFNLPVTFVDHTGISFVNVTTAETSTTFSSATSSPAETIVYNITWVTPPIAGDVVEWRYDPTAGNYRNSFAPIQPDLYPGTKVLGPSWSEAGGPNVWFHLGTTTSSITFLTNDGTLIEGKLYDIDYRVEFGGDIVLTLGGASINGNTATDNGVANISRTLFAENLASVDAVDFEANSTNRLKFITIRRSNNLDSLLLPLSNYLDV